MSGQVFKMKDQIQEKMGKNIKHARGQWRKVVTGSERIRVRDHVRSYEHKPSYIKFFDKVSFTLGVLNICATEYFVIHEPAKYYIWYSIVLPVMLLGRLGHFRSNKMHYFLLDFCYAVNLLSLVHIHYLYKLESAEALFKMGFILSTGPLPAAIPLWKNSLVFHDFDKITSVYIHFLPTCLYYCLKLGVGKESFVDTNLQFKDYANCLLFYLTWQVFYFFKTEIHDRQKLEQDPELLTSLKWLSGNQKNALSKSALKLCRKFGLFGPEERFSSTSMKTKAVFMIFQLIFTIVAMVPTYHAWCYSTFHLSYIATIFVISLFFGASYYVEIFSTRYTTALERAAEKAVMQARTSRSNSNASLQRAGGSVTDLKSFGAGRGSASQSKERVSEVASGGHVPTTDDAVDSEDEENEDDEYDDEYDLKGLWEGADVDYLLVVDD